MQRVHAACMSCVCGPACRTKPDCRPWVMQQGEAPPCCRVSLLQRDWRRRRALRVAALLAGRCGDCAVDWRIWGFTARPGDRLRVLCLTEGIFRGCGLCMDKACTWTVHGWARRRLARTGYRVFARTFERTGRCFSPAPEARRRGAHAAPERQRHGGAPASGPAPGPAVAAHGRCVRRPGPTVGTRGADRRSVGTPGFRGAPTGAMRGASARVAPARITRPLAGDAAEASPVSGGAAAEAPAAAGDAVEASPVSGGAAAGSAGRCGSRRRDAACPSCRRSRRAPARRPGSGCPARRPSSMGVHGFHGARPWGWTARHGAAVDSVERTRGAGLRSMERPWISWSAPVGLDRAPWGGCGRHVRRHGFSSCVWAFPRRSKRGTGARATPGRQRLASGATGAMAGRQRHSGARADFPAVEAARNRGQEKTPRGRSPRGAVAGGKKEKAPEPEGSGAGGRSLRRRGPCRMPPGAAPADGRRCPPRPACGRGSRCSRAGRPRSRSCSGRCRRGPATSGCAACR